MPTFYSPTGNPEVWDNKPDGYFDKYEDYLVTEIDKETSAAIIAGFEFTIQDQTLHFSYDTLDQQNFADTASVANSYIAGVPGLPDSVLWNGWIIKENGTRKLVELVLNAQEFLTLYYQGALQHKITQMRIGTERKKELLGQQI